ncbi:hypothetical protein BBJ28_00011814 [Nothophytophthora sp. Chile5]|nr:hypothetical protein BBJ28_00011814 [Nothophytophthora sp. Chile5]
MEDLRATTSRSQQQPLLAFCAPHARPQPTYYAPSPFSGAPPLLGVWGSPQTWSSTSTGSSSGDGFSPPPTSDEGAAHAGNEWDLLSELLMEDPSPSAFPSAHQNAALATQPPPQTAYVSSPAASVADSSQNANSPSAAAPSDLANISPSQRARVSAASATKRVRSSPVGRSAPSSTTSRRAGGVGRGRGRKAATPAVKTEPLSLEEQKKLRRRSQIASSVQRHREKKKGVVSGLQSDLAQLTAQLATLRAERRSQLADDDQLVAYEEEAMTQRRKRKQAEQTNQRLKQALFQQTAFLGGMRALMGGGGLPCTRELEFHDWVHSYTALASRDALARRKEYVAHFSRSKMQLATKLVLKETEAETARLVATGQRYYSHVRLLHDGTREFHELDMHEDSLVKRELFRSGHESVGEQTPDAGDGRVIKQFASVFLFRETAECTMERLLDVAFASAKLVGVYWPAAGYESRTLDEVEVQEEEEQSRVYFTDLAASMEVVDAAPSSDEITVEARVLCREQRGRDHGAILWDYVDSDALHPLPTGQSSKVIRRNCCGGVVIRREPGTGLLSMRSVSVKAFAPLAKSQSEPRETAPDSEEAQRAVARRIGLQATECERLKERCTRYVYDAIADSFAAVSL